MAVLRVEPRRWARVAFLLTLFGAPSLGVAEPGRQTASVVSRDEMHAAFLLNLTHFITWPAGAFPEDDSSLTIGTFARDPINEELASALAAFQSGGRPVRHVRVQSKADIQKCHVVFVSKALQDRIPLVAEDTGAPVLKVSDADGFLELGGHVSFFPQGTRVGLRISPENLRRTGLVARSQLLRLASKEAP